MPVRTFYCPDSKAIRQFILPEQDSNPDVCNAVIITPKEWGCDIHNCQGKLMPVKNIDTIIPKEQPYA